MLTTAACIITRNRPASLEKCLNCLLAQTIRFDEILVIDNSTDELTKRVIEGRFREIKYHRYSGPLGSLPIQRNIGIKNCKSDIILFTDDDGYPHGAWLEEVVNVFLAEPKAGAVGGRIIQGEATRWEAPICPPIGRYSLIRWTWGTFNAEIPGTIQVDILQGTNMGFRVKSLTAFGGFDPVLAHGYASFEDTDPCLNMKRHGLSVHYNPKAVVVHGLQPREKGIPRDIGGSPLLAYSYARNGVYVELKYFWRRPVTWLLIFSLVPAINTLRCLSSYSPKEGKRIRVSTIRLRSVICFYAGVLAGAAVWLKKREV